MHKRMGFKELLQQDVKNVFLDPAEFGETHMVNGREMPIVIDNYGLRERQAQAGYPKDGSHVKQELIYVAEGDYGPLPKQGTSLTIDRGSYRVVDALKEGGIYQLLIEAGKMR